MIHELRHGRWQDVLADVERCDLLFTDPPYSERTHEGFRSMTDMDPATRKAQEAKYGYTCRNRLGYDALTSDDVFATAALAERLAPWWCVLFGDHQTWQGWDLVFTGWTRFAPVLWIKVDGPPRMSGDGPASAAEYLHVSRPKRRVREHASRPGYYLVNTHKSPLPPSQRVVGMKKPCDLTQILVDYTRPGDLVVDPYAGTATIGQACIETGRQYIGAEVDPDTYALGVKRLRGATPCIPGMEPDRWREAPAGEQSDLFT